MKSNLPRTFFSALVTCLAAVLLVAKVQAGLNVTVVDDKGTLIQNFRWILQEDISAPGRPYERANDTVSIVSHRSDARVIATGSATTSTWPIRVPKYTLPKLVPDGTVLAGPAPVTYPYNNDAYDADPDPTQRYAIEVMASGYSMGGQLVAAGATSVKVIMNRNPLPTTQVSILVFHDHLPLNNEPDSEEEGLPGFRVSLFDNLGGPFTQDAFANPVGTEYQTNLDGTYILDKDGQPTIAKLGDGYIYTDKDGKALIKNMWNDKFGVQVIPPTGENWNGGHASMKAGGYKWQTSTIEGTPFIDAWGAAGGSKVFIEGWGAGFYHVFFGFCDPDQLPGAAPAPGSTHPGITVKGRLRFTHYGRPPGTALVAAGPPVTDGWVGLNIADFAVEGAPPVEGVDKALLPANTAVLAQACDPETGEFELKNIAPGNYQLVSWDRPLDAIWNSIDLAVDPAKAVNGVLDIGDVLVYRWFGTLEGSVFYDANGNGFPDPGEEKIPRVPLNIRFRDGSMYQSTTTKSDGTYSFTEVFPFFKWLVAEVDNARWKSTGMTSVVDDGGVIPDDNGWAMPSDGMRNPQVQYQLNPDGTVTLDPVTHLPTSPVLNNPNTGNPLSRSQVTEKPSEPLLTQALQLYGAQDNRIDWGKQAYAEGENGGISGFVSYNNTRAEADPRFGVAELWDPGIARVQVALYDYEPNYAALAKAAGAGKQTVYGQPYDINFWKIKIHRTGATTPRLADVDNYPYGWSKPGGTRGPEDIDQDDPAHLMPDAGRVFNPGDAIQITHTDSWDDDVAPQANPAFLSAGGWPAGTTQIGEPQVLPGNRHVLGSDNFATWNQVRPGVFDGAYVLNSYFPGGMANPTGPETDYLPPADYIVQASPPRGYLIQTEESRNIVFGDSYFPSQLDLPAEVVGDYHLVPGILNLFPDLGMLSDYANQWRPLADRKLVKVIQGRNAPCDFNMYTEVPKVAHVVGFVLNDVSVEFNPSNPTYGEREGAAWIPVSFRDWAGNEVARTYSDEYGCYDTMIPSTYNAAVPCPSGFAPNMITVVLNDPSMPDPSNPDVRIPDPYYNPGYTVAPVVLEYWPGKVNYADTPIVPIGAFMGSPNGQLDVEPPDGTPVIKFVQGTTVNGYSGPYVGSLDDWVTVTPMGPTQVLDPLYKLHDPSYTSHKITRDYGFGNTGDKVVVNLTPTDRANAGVAINATVLANGTIRFQLDNNALSKGTLTATGGKEWQMMIQRAGGATTPIGITLTYETDPTRVHVVTPIDPTSVGAGVLTTQIQDVIDAAAPGDLVIVPATQWYWNEYLVMYRPIRLQGSGAGTVINGVPDPQSRVPAWHKKVLYVLGDDPFVINECPGVQVFGETQNPLGHVVGPYENPGDTMVSTHFDAIPSRIDGFLFKSAVHGGAINAYDKVNGIRISNNRITGNMGDSFNGGVSIGAPAGGGVEGNEDPGSATDFDNKYVVIEYNQIIKNSSLDGAGGIAIHSGATGYKVRNNIIMGNFCFDAPGAAGALAGAGMGGGGILHMGLSPGGLIADNIIAFNEVFFGYSTGGGDGGGILIQGEADGGQSTGTSGTGSVTIINNLIMGNLSGAGLGGGIRLAGVNGPEILDPVTVGAEGNAPGTFGDDFIGVPSADPAQWYEINILNNMIVNNAAGFSGGGISIQDAIKVNILGNTIVNNDAAAVALNTFQGDFLHPSHPQGAGIVTHPNTAAISAASLQNAATLHPEAARFNKSFSDPILENNIIWHNRSFVFDYSQVTGGAYSLNSLDHRPVDNSGGLVPDTRPEALADGPSSDRYVDLFVVGGAGTMTPVNCILTGSGTPPSFVKPYLNDNVTGIVYDEGGNNSISLRFLQIGIFDELGAVRGDYHLAAPLGGGATDIVQAAPPVGTGFPGLQVDYDGQDRSSALSVDVGADQYSAATGPFLPGYVNDQLAVAAVGLLPNPNNGPYTPTPAPVAGEPPHLPETEWVKENNPNVPPGPMVTPPPLNPVWMTAVPAFGRATPRTFEGAFTTNDIFTLYSFFTRLQAQGNPSSTLAAQSDPVAKYIFDHLSGDWPAAPPVDGEEPAAPDTTTKAMLALWGTGWLIYNQPPNYIPDDGVLLAKIVADMNTALALSGPGTPPNAADNPLAAAYNILLPGGTAVDGYTPSTRTRTLLTQLQLTPGQAKPRLLNRSIMQDAFMEIRRWYDPAITYVHLVCGDGFAKMGDGTELYTFGFSDQTEVANNPTDNPDKGPDKVLAFAHSAATISAPTIVLEQDQEFHLDLSNVGFDYRPDLFDPHTVHFHGFPQAAPIFDGMPMASVSVLEGATLPYFYRLNIEGTYFYHCHVEATEHMQQGMIGNLYVHSRQDKIAAGTPLAHLPPGKGPAHRTSYRYVYNDGDGSTEYDVEYPMQITGFDHHFHDEEIGIQPPAFATLFDTYPLLNGRGYPDTVKTGSIQNSLGINAQQVSSKVTARRGQRVLLRISNVSETDFNTLTVLGIPMTIVGKDARLLRGPDGKNLYYRTTSVTLGGGETADAILDTAGLPIGTYFIYAARLTQLSNDEEDYGGVMTEIQITQ